MPVYRMRMPGLTAQEVRNLSGVQATVAPVEPPQMVDLTLDTADDAWPLWQTYQQLGYLWIGRIENGVVVDATEPTEPVQP